MKTKTKILLTLFPVLLLLIIMSAAGVASVSAVESDGFEYVVTGKNSVKLTSCNSRNPAVTVPSKIDGYSVESIAAGTFAKNPDITYIYIPKSVNTIEDNAFSGCKKLKIYGYGGSVAHGFANKNNITFKVVYSTKPLFISIGNKDNSVAVGSKMNLNAAVFPDNGMGKLDYSSSDEKIASVDDGLVSAKKKGQTYITITNGKLSKKYKVNVYIPVQKITNDNSITLGAGESSYIGNYKVQPSGADKSRIRITSSDTSVAVYKDGKICGIAPGKAYLGIWYNGRKLSYINVTVKKAPWKISFSPASIEAAKGEVVYVSSYVNDGSCSLKREYYSSNSKVARVEKNGWDIRIRAVSEGTADVTVKTYNGKKAVCKVTVKKPAKNIKFKDPIVTIGLGEKCRLISIPIDGAQYYKTYYSWNNKKATVDKNGYVTGKKIGQTTIAVKLPNGKTAKCKLYVKAAPKKIHLGRNKLTLVLGETYLIKSYTDENEASSSRKFSVTDNGVLALDKNNWHGKVTAKKLGTSEIKVATYNGKTDVCKVTVIKDSDRKKVADAGISWRRYNEADGSYMEIFDTYNNGRIPGTYYMRGLDPWCATFVSAAFMKAGMADLIYPSCSCPMMVLGAKNMGIWVEDDAYVPERGDIIVYNWDDDGIGDCDYGAYHVGIVVDVNSGNMKMIEGNRDDNDKNGDDFVEYRVVPINDKFIRGFITPKYKS